MSIALTTTVRKPRRSILPGQGITLGVSLLYLSLIVLVPLSTLFIKAATLHWSAFVHDVTEPEVMAAYKLTFGASLAAAAVNAVFGLLVAWVLTRYTFPLKRVLDAIVDLPFALPTAVAGITLADLYDEKGWLGQLFTKNSWFGQHIVHGGIEIAYTPLGVTVALIFIGLPFVVRTVQPVLQDIDVEMEEAASSLGANRWTTFQRIILPTIAPALLTGFALAFSRALGEYGSVVFISGNQPYFTEIVPVAIMAHLTNYDYAGATAIAVVMLIASFLLLLVINFLQVRSARRFV